MLAMEAKIRSWLLRSQAAYDQLYQESRHSLSGILLRTMYRRFAHPTFTHHHSAPESVHHHHGNHSEQSSVTMSPPRDSKGSVVSGVDGGVMSSPLDGGEEHDAEMTRHVWERNTEQVCQSGVC